MPLSREVMKGQIMEKVAVDGKQRLWLIQQKQQLKTVEATVKNCKVFYTFPKGPEILEILLHATNSMFADHKMQKHQRISKMYSLNSSYYTILLYARQLTSLEFPPCLKCSRYNKPWTCNDGTFKITTSKAPFTKIIPLQ